MSAQRSIKKLVLSFGLGMAIGLATAATAMAFPDFNYCAGPAGPCPTSVQPGCGGFGFCRTVAGVTNLICYQGGYWWGCVAPTPCTGTCDVGGFGCVNPGGANQC